MRLENINKFEVVIAQSDYSRYANNEEVAKNEIGSLPKTIICHFSLYGEIKLNVNYVFSEDFTQYFTNDKIEKFNSNTLFAFQFICEVDNEIIFKAKAPGHPLHSFSQALMEKIIAFSFALQIAMPGLVHFNSEDVQQPLDLNILGLYPSMISLSREVFYYNQDEFNWPPLKIIDVNKVWRWIEPHFEKKISENTTQRALFAFTWIHNDTLSDLSRILVYSLIGIEALYAKGNSNLIEQINEKVQLVLGELTEFKKAIKKMYNFRSRLVHGDLDIPSILGLDYDYDRINDYDSELYHSALLSVGILISTFQWMIENSQDEIRFENKLIIA